MSRPWRALLLLCLAQFMVILDVTVVNVALPRMAGDLGLDRAALTWVVTAYTLCFGGLMMLGGRLADLLGRRRVFLAGLLVFTGASLVAGLAGGAGTIVAARAVQGVGAAMLSPAALSIVTTTFHGPERNRALGIWAAIGGGGAAAGVLVGGLLVSGPGWQWVFFVNVPVGAAVGVLLPWVVPGTVPGTVPAPSPHRGRIDVAGALLVTAGSAALIYGLVRAGDAGWAAASTLAPIAAAAVLYLLFAVVERHVPAPLVHLPLLTQRSMAAGVAAMLTASGLLVSGFFLCSLLLQGVLGLSALRTGLVFLPVAVAAVAGAHTAARLVARIGPRPLAAAAFGLAAAGLALLSRVGEGADAWTAVLPGFALAAIGLGGAFVTATTTAMREVHPHHAGMASGAVNTAHELGSALGVAVVSTIAGASIHAGGASGGAAVGGFTDALAAAAVAALVAAVVVPVLLPAGRPPVADRPAFAH
jgi:EmrB/QacA subfamily drug resistance transporter